MKSKENVIWIILVITVLVLSFVGVGEKETKQVMDTTGKMVVNFLP